MSQRTPIQPADFEKWSQVILSDQMDASEVVALLADNPDFSDWYRAKQLLAPSRTPGYLR